MIMRVIEKIKNAKSPLFTFELLPPLKGHTLDRVYEAVERLMEFSPAYINFTSHRNEVEYLERSDGSIERRILRKRPGTIALSAAVKYKYNITVVPHLLVGGFSKEETENALIEMNFLGIDDVLALRGDPPKGSRLFIPEERGHNYASELVGQIVAMNKGRYIDDSGNNAPTNFCIGVAGYPEKHVESANRAIDIENLKKKVEAGAEYIVTQMFFDNKKFFAFRDACRDAGITIPLVPGLKPVSALNDLRLLPQTFNIDLPDDLVRALGQCKTNSDAVEVGIEWTTMQSKELLKADVPGIHYYSLGRSDNLARIARASY